MNFFGMLGQIGRMFPGYVEGRRAAYQDNWNDLANYNSVYHGQLQNAFDTNTFESAMSDVANNAAMRGIAAQQAAAQNKLFQAVYDGIYPYVQTNAQTSAQLQGILPQIDLLERLRMLGYMNPAMMQGLPQLSLPTQTTQLDPRARMNQQLPTSVR